MAMLKEKQDRLAEVEGHIAKLLASYNTSVAEKQLLEDNIAQVWLPHNSYETRPVTWPQLVTRRRKYRAKFVRLKNAVECKYS